MFNEDGNMINQVWRDQHTRKVKQTPYDEYRFVLLKNIYFYQLKHSNRKSIASLDLISQTMLWNCQLFLRWLTVLHLIYKSVFATELAPRATDLRK